MINKRIGVILSALLVPLLLSACEGRYLGSAKFEGVSCPKKGGTFVNVHYGDSLIRVQTIAKVHREAAFEFRLKPDKRQSDLVNYETVQVTIKGKDTRSNWIPQLSGNARTVKDGGSLVFCVPDTVDIGKDYMYWVEVDTVGRLDPRADVEH